MQMRWRLAAVLGAATAGLVVSAPFAIADDVEGGHCEYGDFSVNVEPSCDTSSSDSDEAAAPLQDSTDEAGSIDRALDQIPDIFGGL